jgi:predicted Zn-dependent protease
VEQYLALQVGMKGKLREADHLERSGHLADAIGILRQLTQTHPTAIMYIKLAAALGKTGDTAATEYAVREALRLDAHAERAHHLLGVTLFVRAKTAPSSNPGVAALYREAVEHFRLSLQQKPANAEAHMCAGQALFALGEKTEAIKHLRMAIVCRPERYEGYYYLGDALAELGNTDEAVLQLRTAVQLAPPADRRPTTRLTQLTMGKN